MHPESYGAVRILLSELDIREDDIGKPETRIKEKAEAYGMKKLAEKCGTGIPTLTDIISELGKPGRDIRDSLPQPVLRSDLLGMENLREGTELEGVVRNVTDFGVFVDIGVHQDGLVHITQISNGFVKHPSEVLGVGDRVKVRVIGVDTAKNKISLSLKTSDRPGGIAAPERGGRKSGENGFPKKRKNPSTISSKPFREDSRGNRGFLGEIYRKARSIRASGLRTEDSDRRTSEGKRFV